MPNYFKATKGRLSYHLCVECFSQLSFDSEMYTLASGIDVGQGINVGPEKFGKKNKRRALNTHVLCSK